MTMINNNNDDGNHTDDDQHHGDYIYRTYKVKIILTGGSAVGPVRVAYCLNTSCGLGPSITNTSIIPLSENQCVSTWGTSSSALKNDIREFNMDWKGAERWEIEWEDSAEEERLMEGNTGSYQDQRL